MVAANQVETACRSRKNHPPLFSHLRGIGAPPRPIYRMDVQPFRGFWNASRRANHIMQVLLRKSDSHRDVQCPVCSQTFRIYWERTSVEEQNTMRAIVLEELHEQHSQANGGDKTSSAHPGAPFNVPRWTGSPQFSGAALLGGLSGMHRVPRRGTKE